MQVICKDGTTIQCQEFEAIDSGVLFYQDTQQSETEEADEAPESASGFVPITEIRFVLPDEMVQAGQQRASLQEQGQQPRPPQGGVQQATQQYQGPPQQGPGTGSR